MESINILNRFELVDEIRKMFQEEQKRLIIVSPFLDLNNELIEMLDSSPARIHFLIRELKRNDEYKKMSEIMGMVPKVDFIEIKDLHAKAFMSKEYTIIASLNLLKYSQENNFELGIIFKNVDYPELYNKFINELKDLLKENHHDENIMEEPVFSKFLTIDEYNENRTFGRKVYNMKYLFRDIMEKNGKSWVYDDPLNEIYINVCNIMRERYKDTFKPEDYYRDGTALNRQTWITKEMYLYGIDAIKV